MNEPDLSPGLRRKCGVVFEEDRKPVECISPITKGSIIQEQHLHLAEENGRLLRRVQELEAENAALRDRIASNAVARADGGQ